MLQLLTQYLTQTNSVTIPQVGSLALQRQPATWSVADQSLAGPCYRTLATERTEPTTEQLYWLAGAAQQSEFEARENLDQFGLRLQQHLRREPFLWPGVGLLHWQEGQLQVHPETPVSMPSLPASKVIREDARHNIRIGEQEVASNFYEERTVVAEGRHDLEWLAWLLVVLAALFVFYCIYNGGFSPHSSGLQTSVSNSLP
ncbi:MAG: hypothetical protein EOO15_09700 [Chitinophagaceae bacterium]|nr:MAG: hypothetical protein EOO15_09700 [Chitinophagaceae bacterium]